MSGIYTKRTNASADLRVLLLPLRGHRVAAPCRPVTELYLLGIALI